MIAANPLPKITQNFNGIMVNFVYLNTARLDLCLSWINWYIKVVFIALFKDIFILFSLISTLTLSPIIYLTSNISQFFLNLLSYMLSMFFKFCTVAILCHVWSWYFYTQFSRTCFASLFRFSWTHDCSCILLPSIRIYLNINDEYSNVNIGLLWHP